MSIMPIRLKYNVHYEVHSHTTAHIFSNNYVQNIVFATCIKHYTRLEISKQYNKNDAVSLTDFYTTQ